MSIADDLADRILAVSQTAQRRIEEKRQRLQARLHELRSEVVPVGDDEPSRMETMKSEIARIDALLAESHAEAARASSRIVALCRDAADGLLAALRARLALQSRTALHERVDDALRAFAPDLQRGSIPVKTAAQRQAAIASLVALARQRRERLAGLFANAAQRAGELQAHDERRLQLQQRIRHLDEVEREFLANLAQHADRSTDGSLVEGILQADERTAVSLGKHLLAPLLADLRIEKENGLYGADPLEVLEKTMTGGLAS